MRDKFLGLTRVGAVSCLTLAASLMTAVDVRAGETGLLQLHCTNLANGANWPIVVDLEHGRVDAFPATITDTRITWRDPKGGTYELERATGKLQLRGASSTGGYFIRSTCQAG